jgi:mannose/fructose/N-acetylgalactosamine-specific phosphotransferase system component IIC
MQNLGSRFVGSCLLFWGGLHVVGFGMIANGSARRGNPTWELIGPLLGFEWMAVKNLALIALAAAGIVVAYFVLAAVLGLVSLVIEKWEQIRRNGVNDRPSAP